MTVFKLPSEATTFIPNSWAPKDEPVLPVHDERLTFTPMLTVDIQTGKVLLDRRDEVMRRMSERGGMYGRW